MTKQERSVINEPIQFHMLHCIRSVLYSFAELILCLFFQASAWLNTSKDPIHGNDKRRDTF